MKKLLLSMIVLASGLLYSPVYSDEDKPIQSQSSKNIDSEKSSDDTNDNKILSSKTKKYLAYAAAAAIAVGLATYLRSKSTNIAIVPTNSLQKMFSFKPSLFERQKATVDEIKNHIANHAVKRTVDNWFFTSTKLHTATLKAIELYRGVKIPNERIESSLQTILNSHGNYLYNPFYLNEIKHLRLVDQLSVELTGNRYNIDHSLDAVKLPVPTSSVHHYHRR